MKMVIILRTVALVILFTITSMINSLKGDTTSSKEDADKVLKEHFDYL